VFNEGRLSQAVPLIESALARDPDNKDLLHLLSECYMHSPQHADPRRAAALMERLLALDPDYHLVYNHLALAYIFLGEFGRVREKLDEWEAQEPQYVLIARAQLAGREGRLDEALRLIESAPRGAAADFMLSRYALASGRFEVVRSIVVSNRDNSSYSWFLPLTEADLHVNVGEFGRAEALYRAILPVSLEVDERSRMALAFHHLAELLALKGDLKGAQREAERALILQPEGPYCLYFAGMFALRAGDLIGAEGLLGRLEEIASVARGPLVPHYRDALAAEIELARGRPAEATRLLEKAVNCGMLQYEAMQFTPGPVFRDGLSRSHRAMGDKRKAAEVLEALLTDPLQGVGHPVIRIRAHYSLGVLKLELGDQARGHELLRRFLEYWGKTDWDLPEVRDARARLASSTP
jgi:tetratricopeptide (TPR) repeat protein